MKARLNSLRVWRARALLLGLSIGFGYLLAESVLRLWHGAPPWWTYPQEYYRFDPELGHALEPLQSSFTHDKPVHTNSLGLRDAEFPSHRDATTVRILALGDSQTFGTGVALEDTWPKRLQSALNDHNAKRWEVINAGLPASDTWQHEIILGRLLGVYHPDVVVLAFYVNDARGAFTPDPQHSYVSTNTGAHRLAYWLKRSALVTAVLQATRTVWSAVRPASDFHTELNVINGTPDPLVEQGWLQVEQSLSRMKIACEGAGAHFMIIVIPRHDQVLGTISSTAFNARIGRIATAHHVRLRDTLGPLRAAHERLGSRLFIPWDGHNSALANEVIARTTAEEIYSLAFP